MIERDADDFKPFVVQLPIRLDNVRNLRAARRAPRGPEIHEHHFPAHLRQIHGAAVQSSKLQLRDVIIGVCGDRKEKPGGKREKLFHGRKIGRKFAEEKPQYGHGCLPRGPDRVGFPVLLRCLLFVSLLAANAAPSDTARIADRYKEMLEKSPAEGTALDRLWALAQESGTTGKLLEEYKTAADGNFAGALIFGHLLRKAGRADEARAAYEKAEAWDAKSALPHLALAALASERGQSAEAAGEWEKAAAIFPPDDARRVDALVRLGDARLAAHEPEKAAAALEAASLQHPDDLALHQRLAEIFEQNGLGEKAATHWQWIAEHGDTPQSARADQNLARIFQAAGHPDAAIAALEKALALTAPDNWLRGELQAQLIRLCQRNGREAELETRWKKAVEENPRDLAGWLQLADFYGHVVNAAGERAALEKLCALAPQNTEYKLRLERACETLGDTDRAAGLLDELISARPADADLVFERAGLDLQRNAAGAAKARVEELLKRSSDDTALTARAIAWFEKNHLSEAAEMHLKENAARDEAGALALASWYFANRRPEEARRTLRQIADADQAPEAKAATLAKVADTFKANDDLESTIEPLRRAAELLPKSAAPRLALADTLLAAGRFDEAQIVAGQAFDLAADDAARLTADQKLFQIFQARAAQRDGATAPLGATSPRGVPTVAAEDSETAQFVAGLAQAAEKSPTADKFLRLARWQFWNRKYREALGFARRALELDPHSADARELAVKAAEADGQRAAAISLLQELARLHPENAAASSRRIGQLELAAGHLDEALRIFTAEENAHPGDVDALSDLARAQQAADRWYDALATWQRAFDASPVAKKKDVAAALLRVFERLGLFQKGAELLLGMVDAQNDDRAREAALGDLLTFCKRHELNPWLEAEFAKRHRTRPDDYFAATAYAKALKANGRASAAFGVLADAAFIGPDDAASLQNLAREAGELGNAHAAALLQRRLVAARPPGEPEAVEKLAALQEADVDIAGATETWEKICRVFSRDPAALNEAAEYFRRWGGDSRAREILREVRALDPQNNSALFALARVAGSADSSDGAAEALSCYEQILQNIHPGRRGDALKIPGMKLADNRRLKREYISALRTRSGAPTAEAMGMLKSFGAEDTSEPESTAGSGIDLRLAAIREASQTLSESQNREALRAWLARWQNAESRTEALWAFYYSGATDRVLAELRAMLAHTPADARAKQAFIWLTLQMGKCDALREWTLDERRTPLDHDMLTVVLGQFLKSNPAGEIAADLVLRLFREPWPRRSLLWQCAQLFAAQGRLADAEQLGRRAVESQPDGSAADAVALAHWQLFLGEKTRAQETLRRVLAQSGDVFDAPIYEAVREYFLLLPKAQRAPFVETFERGLDRGNEPLHAAIATALVRGLVGDEAGAKEELSLLLELRAVSPQTPENPGDSSNRFWTFMLTAGLQLQSWKLDSLAIFIWERALADPAGIRLQGDQAENIAREIRARLFASKLARADAFDAETMVENFVRGTPADEAMIAASILENNGSPAAAAQVSRALWERDRTNPTLLRAVLNACRGAGDAETARAVLREVKEDPEAHPGMKREAALGGCDLLENEAGGARDALDFIEAALVALPNDVGLLEREARLQDRAGHFAESEAAYRRLLTAEPGNSAARIALADLWNRAAKTGEAIALLEKNPSPESDAKLAELYLAADRPDEAMARAQEVLRSGNVPGAARLAELFARRNAGRRPALRLLLGAITRSKDQRAAFALEAKFVELLAAENPELARGRLRRMENLVNESPELEPEYFDLRSRVAKTLRIDFEKTLAEEWDDGGGSVEAGARLIVLRVKNGGAADPALARLLALDGADESVLPTLGAQLRGAGRPDLAARVDAALCRKFPLNDQYPPELAATLHELGRDADARQETRIFSLRQIFNGKLAGVIARLFADLGEGDAAREMFAAAVADDPGAREPETFFACADFLQRAGETGAALDALRRAFRNPATRDVARIVRFYADAGRLGRLENEAASFHLAPGTLRALFAATFARYASVHAPREAMGVLEAHPEIAGCDSVLPLLRGIAGSDDSLFARMTGLLENAIAQAPGAPESQKLAHELALIYRDHAAGKSAARGPRPPRPEAPPPHSGQCRGVVGWVPA